MRIISGRLKGLKFGNKVFEGTRPTTDRMRESMFNALSHYVDFSTVHEVLDICSGTGALGFEAISRGAKRCIFVELQSPIAKEIRNSAQFLGITQEQSPIAVQDAIAFFKGLALNQLPSNIPKSWDCIFCDPPYSARMLNHILNAINQNQCLNTHGILIAEHDDVEHIILPKGYTTLSTLSFGKTLVDIIRKD